MTRGVRPAQVRFYIDQDLLGLAKVLGSLRSDLTYPGDPGETIYKRARPPSPVPQGAADTTWIPIVATERWLIISRDRAIQDSLSELTTVRDQRAKMVCLTGDSAATKWAQLEAVMAHWRRLESLTDRDGPFVYKVTRASFNEVDIDDALDRIRRGRRARNGKGR